MALYQMVGNGGEQEWAQRRLKRSFPASHSPRYPVGHHALRDCLANAEIKNKLILMPMVWDSRAGDPK